MIILILVPIQALIYYENSNIIYKRFGIRGDSGISTTGKKQQKVMRPFVQINADPP
jgi:hypothetical protein